MSERPQVSAIDGVLVATLKSSNIERVQWEHRANVFGELTIAFGTLLVTFSNGTQYEYSNVSQGAAEGFANAESPGKFFAREIKGKYEFKKVTA